MVKWKEKWVGEIAWVRRLEYKNHAYTLESFRCVNSVQHPTSVIRSTETKALIKGLSLEIIQGWVMPGAKGNFFAKAYLPAASWPLVSLKPIATVHARVLEGNLFFLKYYCCAHIERHAKKFLKNRRHFCKSTIRRLSFSSTYGLARKKASR